MKIRELNKMFVDCNIAEDIENIVKLEESTYLEAIIVYCEEKDVAPEDISIILPVYIKEKLELECLDRKLVKGEKPISLDDCME